MVLYQDILKSQRFYRLLFQIFIFLLPTQLAYHFWPDWALVAGIRVDYLAPAIYLTDILLLAICCMHYAKNSLPKISWWVAFFISINILVSTRWQISVLKWLKLGELFLLAYVVAKDKSLQIIEPLKYSVIFFTCIGIVQFILGHTLGGLFYWLGERSFSLSTPGIALVKVFDHLFLRPYSTFSHPNSLAGFLGVCLLLFIIAKKKVPAIISLAGMIFTFSTGAIIGLLGCRLPRKFLPFVFGFLILASFLVPVISVRLINFGYQETIFNRLVLWVASGKIFSEHFLLGVGLNNFILELPKTLVQNQSVWLLQPVHNVINLLLTETGLVGLGIFILGVFKYSRKINPRYLPIFMFVFLTSMVDHYFLTLQQNLLLLAVVTGLAFRTS